MAVQNPTWWGTPVAPDSTRAQVKNLWTNVVSQIQEAWSLAPVRLGMLGTTGIALGSFTPAFLPSLKESESALRLRVGWLQGGVGQFVATFVLMLGVALLVEAWLRSQKLAMKGLLPNLTWLLWSLPLMACPPLFSRDAYSYAAQGLIVARGMDPYRTGPISVPGAFADNVDALWLFTPAPYGPVSLQVAHAVVDLTDRSAFLSAVAMRIPAVIAVAVLAYALPRIAEVVGVNPGQALWLGVLNPLVIMHLVGGAHNDAMMIGCVALGLLFAARGQLVAGSLTIALAAGFKQTAVLALVGVAGLVLRAKHADISFPRYFAYLVKAGFVALAGFTVLTYLTGLGWGWTAVIVSVPASIRSLLSPPTLLGQIVEWALIWMQAPTSWLEWPVKITQKLGMVGSLVAAAWFTFRVAPHRPVTAAAGILLAACLGAPVIHPWYMLWGGVILAAAALSPRTKEIAVWVTVFFVGYSVLDAAFSNGLWALGLTTLAVGYWRFRGPTQPDYRDTPGSDHLTADQHAAENSADNSPDTAQVVASSTVPRG